MLKFDNRNTWKSCEICFKLTKSRHWHISNISRTYFTSFWSVFYCWLWVCKCLLDYYVTAEDRPGNLANRPLREGSNEYIIAQCFVQTIQVYFLKGGWDFIETKQITNWNLEIIDSLRSRNRKSCRRVKAHNTFRGLIFTDFPNFAQILSKFPKISPHKTFIKKPFVKTNLQWKNWRR